jgi:predicted TIM-barrel fold metal-dependent hydrolase
MQIIDINARFGSYPSRYKTTSVDDLIADSQAHDVSITCALSTTGVFFSDEEGNSETLEAYGRYSNNLAPIATINPRTCLKPLGMVDSIKKLGFKAVRFFPTVQDWPIDFAPMREILACMGSANLSAIVGCAKHGDSTAIAELVNKHYASSNASVILEGITVETFVEAVSAMRLCKNLGVETHSLHFPDGLTLIRDSMGADRIFFGSGASAQSIGAAISYVSQSQLSDSDKEKVLGGNAFALLGLS